MEGHDSGSDSASGSGSEGPRYSGLAGMLGFFADGGTASGTGVGAGCAAASRKRGRGAAAGGDGDGGGSGGGAPLGAQAQAPRRKRPTHRGAGGAPTAAPADPCAVFVHGIPFSVLDGAPLVVLLAAAGPVVEARVALDKEGRGRGFGYARFETEAAAAAAMALHAAGALPLLQGRALTLQPCHKEIVDKFHEAPKQPKPKPPVFGSARALMPRSVRMAAAARPPASGSGGGGGGGGGAAGRGDTATIGKPGE
jgi:hypothetical protein